ncbi:hypothetical protein HMI56_004399 [Coelomomyces lativittatus]|nr:hypothetical protein HMI56_004399 [Coelomomyces lativittatus]
MKFSLSILAIVLATCSAVQASYNPPAGGGAYDIPPPAINSASPGDSAGPPGPPQDPPAQVPPPQISNPPIPIHTPPPPPVQQCCCPCSCSCVPPPPVVPRNPTPTPVEVPNPPPADITPGQASPNEGDGFTTTSLDEEGNVFSSSGSMTAPLIASFAVTMMVGVILV